MSSQHADDTDCPVNLQEATHYVLGGARAGTVIAEQLHASGHRVAIVDDAYESTVVPGVVGDPVDSGVLAEAGVATASAVLVMTRSDRRNLLAAQLVRTRFDVPRIITLVHEPDRRSLFADAGHEPVCMTTILAEAVDERI